MVYFVLLWNLDFFFCSEILKFGIENVTWTFIIYYVIYLKRERKMKKKSIIEFLKY